MDLPRYINDEKIRNEDVCTYGYVLFRSEYHEKNYKKRKITAKPCMKLVRMMVPLSTYNELMLLLKLCIKSKLEYIHNVWTGQHSDYLVTLSKTLDKSFIWSARSKEFKIPCNVVNLIYNVIEFEMVDGSHSFVNIFDIGPGMEFLRICSVEIYKTLRFVYNHWFIKKWTPHIHHTFPRRTRRIIKTMLLLRQRKGKYKEHIYELLAYSPIELLYYMFSVITW